MQYQSSEAPSQQPKRDLPTPNLHWYLGGFLLLLLLMWASTRSRRNTQIPKGMPMAQEATKADIQQASKKARRIRAAGDITKTAVRLNHETGITLGPINPGGIVSGRAGTGKSKNFGIPIIESHAECGDSLVITDPKGELMESTAGYLHHLGYDIHCIAPGIVAETNAYPQPMPFSGGVNLLDFLSSAEDLAGTLEMTRGININALENYKNRHQYFGPQGDLFQQSMMLAAKKTEYDDMLMVWELMGLTDVAERLQAAQKHGLMNGDKDLPYFMTHLSRGLRAVAGSSSSSNPGPTIQSTASQAFAGFLDPGIAKCFMKTTIPLDLTGKQAIFLRINEDQLQATTNAITAITHMLIKRNISYTRKRDNNLVLLVEEASFHIFPDLKKWAALGRQLGFICWMIYQQEEQMHESYGKEAWETIAGNLPVRIYMNQGSYKSNQIVASRLGKKTIISTKDSESYGSNRTKNRSDSFEQVDLITPDRLDAMNQPGRCIIVDPSCGAKAMFYENESLPYDEESPQALVREQCKKVWQDEILPSLQKEHEKIFGDIDVKKELKDRAGVAEDLLPPLDYYEIEKEADQIKSEDKNNLEGNQNAA